MADKSVVWRLGTIETEISRIGGKSGRSWIAPWDIAFAAGLTVACLLSYAATTLLCRRLERENRPEWRKANHTTLESRPSTTADVDDI